MIAKNSVLAALTTLAVTGCGTKAVPDGSVIYSSEEFTVTTDSVEQGPFVARAVSPYKIVTNYKSPEESGISRLLHFRLSINSRDNELPQGLIHQVEIGSDTVFTFGEALKEVDSIKQKDSGLLPKDTEWTMKVNMQPVLNSFKEKGYYVTPTNDTIYKDDFKGVWVAGSVDPLTWDFENLYGKHDRKLQDRGDGIYEVTLHLNPTTEIPENPQGWEIDSLPEGMPRYSSDQPLMDALYNMSMMEVAGNLRPDSTYRAGKEWDGVWTRDVAYSTYLALAYLDPQNALRSLQRKLKDTKDGKVIIQDTGTGGSWPVSSDRVVWAMAAWEIYKVTGDKHMLDEAIEAIENTLNDDMTVVWNDTYKLMRGEQSYLDWREQTYPKWMQPVDIYESMCLGTNVMFAEAFKVRDLMIKESADTLRVPLWVGIDKEITNSINNNLWIPNMGYYSEYLYGGFYPIQSQAMDNLGQALAIIFDVANPEMARSIISNTPYTPYGMSSVYPQLPDIKPYHNDAVWPFVQAYWNLAAAKVKNMTALEKGLASMMRAAALFGTNKELFVAHNGDYRGTAVNSDSQLWSCTGMAAMVYRVIMGMDFSLDGIHFDPMVPSALTGTKTLSGLKYRDAVVTVKVDGTGNHISSFSINGEKVKEHVLPADTKGNVTVEIKLNNQKLKQQSINNQPQAWMPSTPIIKWITPTKGEITNFQEGISYGVTVNSNFLDQITTGSIDFVPQPTYSLLDIVPVEKETWSGFTCRPYEYIPEGTMTLVNAAEIAPTGTKFISDKELSSRFIESSKQRNTRLDFTVNIVEPGDYLIDVRYANGSGPINTENKCAIRQLYVNDASVGAIVMPQRGIDEWLSTGLSNMLAVKLKSGNNRLSLRLEVDNMNGEVNTYLLHSVRIIKK